MLDSFSLLDQGQREYQEDRLQVVQLDNDWELVMIADGHGGKDVAEFLVENAPRHFDAISNSLTGKDSFRNVYLTYDRLDEEIKRRCNSYTVGSTLTTICLNTKKNVIVAANCGDSMAIVGNKWGSRWMSREHKASSEVEAIEARGGKVFAPDGIMQRVNGTLNMSRAMGDFYLKQFITCSPFVTRCKLSDFDYAFVASDGIWDVMNKDEVHMIIEKHTRKQNVPIKELLEAILTLCRARGSGDNVAIVMTLLNDRFYYTNSNASSSSNHHKLL